MRLALAVAASASAWAKASSELMMPRPSVVFCSKTSILFPVESLHDSSLELGQGYTGRDREGHITIFVSNPYF